ncbi:MULTISPECIES: carbohydrate ABC transporter permease [unclassified Oceanispirochaeta]|uniref:carbohydrate ABC transporter permease n=1 Tax=unclassified Oceanispirochaeta TaxID=2635722 RepID=UPI000E09B9F9|nr:MULTISPECIES: sugar ABC transporter permease [unclassified Oceanispirochaeta]MBF9016544.1 sugar ABC transporter permease [Oceanispirochaeta sp. M2]NPD73006.1 sugar ABC transporter permease [Oceanispirochaeta sp. M1]RDG31350.1 sugar ABC transporter permease [Oceanispirochaeta sp. M1]
MNNYNRYYPISFLLPALVIFGFFFILPTVMGFLLAFTQYSSYQQTLSFIGIKNFLFLFQHPQFQTAFWNTIKYALFSTLLKTLCGLILALLLIAPLRTSSILKTLFYLPAILSPIIVAVMFQTVFRMDGLLNGFLNSFGLSFLVQDWMGQKSTVLGTVITMDVWKWAGFNMAIFIAGLQSIPSSFFEAASMDGASYFQKIVNITLPLLMPAMSINMTSNFIGGLNVFEQVLGLTGGGPGYSSQVIGTLVYQSYSQGYYGRASAMGMIQILITLVLGTAMYSYLSKREVTY